jgi:hypothetical protein
LSLSLGGTLCGCAQLLCRHLRAMRIIYILYTARSSSSSFFSSCCVHSPLKNTTAHACGRPAVRRRRIGFFFFDLFGGLVLQHLFKTCRTDWGGSRLFVFLFGVALPCFAFPLFFFLFFLSHFMIIIISRLLSYAMALYCCCSISNDLVRPSCLFFSSAASPLFCDDGLLSNVQHDAQKSSSFSYCCCWTISQFRR